jgi:hypothetical protein
VLGCIVVVVGREMRDWEREGKEETKRGMCVYTPIIKGHNKMHIYKVGKKKNCKSSACLHSFHLGISGHTPGPRSNHQSSIINHQERHIYRP